MLKVASNSSSLIHLAKIEQLDLLRQIFGGVMIPEAVYKECVIEGKNREDAKKIEKAKWIKVTEIKDKNLEKALTVILDEGEAETIVLALEESVDLILLDDYEAREIARSYGLKVTGTMGVLMRAKSQGKINSLRENLDRLRNSGFWITEDLYTRILQQGDEL